MLQVVAGYSGTPLARKLAIKPHSRLLLLRAPEGFAIPELPDGVTPHRRAGHDPYDTILLFSASKAEMAQRFSPATARLTTSGGIWTCWPKKASGIATDLTENALREIGLATEFVDVKVCAVDETWSGLRFVRRLKHR